MDDLRYPIGKFSFDPASSREKRALWIDRIASFPARLAGVVGPLSEGQLDTPYRPDGWTVRQVIHHLADSHVNAYVRFRLGLTEQNPAIKTYEQSAWAVLEDARIGPIPPSLEMLSGTHSRWTQLLCSLGEADFGMTLEHPEWGAISLDMLLQLYAWHGDHHLAQIERLQQRKGWS